MGVTVEAQGTVFRVGAGDGPPQTMNAVGNVTGFDGPGGQASVIDGSDLDSTAREKRMGLPDEGQITLNLNLNPADINGQNRLRTLRSTRAQGAFDLTLNDTSNTRYAFNGYVLGFLISGAVDQLVTGSVTIEIDGAVTVS